MGPAPHPKGPKIEKIQSRLKISISLENFNLDWKFQSWPSEFPTKNRGLLGVEIEIFNLDWKFQSRRAILNFFNLWALRAQGLEGPGNPRRVQKESGKSTPGQGPKSPERVRPGVSKESEKSLKPDFRTLLRLRGALFPDLWGPAPEYSFRTLFGLLRGSWADSVWGGARRKSVATLTPMEMRATHWHDMTRTISRWWTSWTILFKHGEAGMYLGAKKSTQTFFVQSLSTTLRVMDVRAENRGRPHQKVRFPAAPVVGRNFWPLGIRA